MEKKILTVEILRTKNGGFFVSYDGDEVVCTGETMSKDFGQRLLDSANMMAKPHSPKKVFFVIQHSTKASIFSLKLRTGAIS